MPDQILVLESEWYGRKLRRKSDGHVYNVEKVLIERWTLDGGTGWWIKLLIERDKSHNLLYWQNINCTYPGIADMCKNNQKLYEWV